MNNYGYTKEVNLDFQDAINRVIETLKNEGFGVLTQINLKEKFQEKLGKDFTDYVILGACNPGIAYEVLQSEIEIGLLLPCNIIVYKKYNKVFVSSIIPSVGMSFIDNPEIEPLSIVAEKKLKAAIDNI